MNQPIFRRSNVTVVESNICPIKFPNRYKIHEKLHFCGHTTMTESEEVSKQTKKWKNNNETFLTDLK